MTDPFTADIATTSGSAAFDPGPITAGQCAGDLVLTTNTTFADDGDMLVVTPIGTALDTRFVIQERIADGKASFDVCNVGNANAHPASFAVVWVLFENPIPAPF